MSLARHNKLAQLDKHQTSKPVLISCEFNSHWRQLQFLLKLFKTPRCQFCTEMSDLFYLRKPRMLCQLNDLHQVTVFDNVFNTQMIFLVKRCSSGSSGRVRRGPRNMKSMQPPLAAIFFMTYFHRARGAMAPSPPPGSATEVIGIYVFCATLKIRTASV